NFANSELPGRQTDVPWALIYPGDVVGRHPSSLYQFFLEGIVLFTILWLYSRKRRPEMAVSGLFLIGYGTLRIVSEFFREPDAHIGFVAFDWVTMGQILSLPMLILGMGLMTYAVSRRDNS
ncbi:MAG: prolipoprotein diacylglyceryl transferase, partial [Pseudomonadales bacterium]